jgi:cortactin
LFIIDGTKGFGGAYGVDQHAKDKSAVGFDYKAEVEKHPSQTGLIIFIFIKETFLFSDFSKGFGGKYGTDPNAQDKSAVGFSHKETVPKHPSQQGCFFLFKILLSILDIRL